MENTNINELFRQVAHLRIDLEKAIAETPEDKREDLFRRIWWHVPGGVRFNIDEVMKSNIETLVDQVAEELEVDKNIIFSEDEVIDDREENAGGSLAEPEVPVEEPTEQDVWDGESVEEPEQDEEGIYIIKTAANLAWLSENVASTKDNVYKLTADINLDNKDWNPIGTKVNKIATPGATWFEGTLDGDGHTISNLLVRVQDEYAKAGLFGLFCGTVKNLKIDNATIHSTHYAAVIAPYISDRGKKAVITNCEVTNSRVVDHIEFSTGQADNGDKAAIFVGYVSSNFEVSNCKASNVEVEGYRDIAILVGFASQSKTGTKVMEVFDNVIENAVVRQNFQDGYKDVEEMANRKGTDLGFYEGTGLTKCSNNVGEAELVEINRPDGGSAVEEE